MAFTDKLVMDKFGSEWFLIQHEVIPVISLDLERHLVPKVLTCLSKSLFSVCVPQPFLHYDREHTGGSKG